MASAIGKLVIPIDADLGGLQRAINRSKRIMAQSAKDLGGLATSLSQSISAPLALAGVGAIKAAADFGKLRDGLVVSMKDAGYSMSQAQAELVALRQEAKAPGLDFEQAVKGSLRLQSVRFSAEQARKILREMGNEIARTGGSAENLDSVTKQFAQMIGKGRILQEDISIIAENMPGLAKHMDAAFGTSSVEKIRAMGISTQDFVLRLTDAMSKSSRASGGLANEITNAFSSVKQAAATLGEVLSQRLNVGPNLAKFGDWVVGLADAFANLSPTAQSAILATGAFALALGPGIKAGSLLVSSIGGVSQAFTALRGAMSTVQASGFIGWWKTLGDVVKANYIGLAVGAVIALGAAFVAFSDNASPAATALEAVRAATVEAQKNMVSERTEVEKLRGVLGRETSTRWEKHAALLRLKSLAPDLFRQYDHEKYKIEEVNKSLDAYIARIEKRAQLSAFNAKLEEINKKIIDANNGQAEGATLLQKGYAGVATVIAAAAGQTLTYTQAVQAYADENSKSLLPGLEATREALQKQIAELEKAGVVTDNNTNNNNNLGDGLDRVSKKSKVFAEALSDVRKQIDKAGLQGADAFESEVDAISSGLDKLLDAGYSKDSKQVQQFVGMMKALRESAKLGSVAPLAAPSLPGSIAAPAVAAPKLDFKGLSKEGLWESINGLNEYKSVAEQLGTVNQNLQYGLVGVGEGFAQTAAIVAESGSVMQQLVVGMSAAMVNSTDAAVTKYMEMRKAAEAGGVTAKENAKAVKAGMNEVAQAAISSGAKIIRSYVQQMVTRAALSAMQAVPFPFNLAAATAAGAAANALVGMLIARVASPRLAAGGIAYGPTSAIVGEYPGAAANPEVIAPLSKLQSIIGGRGGDVNVVLSGMLSADGQMLRVLLDQVDKRNARIS